jgi:3-dehydroquinate dehydratase type I
MSYKKIVHGKHMNRIKPIPKSALCGCLPGISYEEIALLLHTSEVDFLEWRLDLFIQAHSLRKTLNALSLLAVAPRLPVLVTNRPVREGGVFDGDEVLRLEILNKAVAAGAEWVDLEEDTPGEIVEDFKAAKVRTVLSHHDFSGTPGRLTLHRLAERMARKKTDVLKIVTHAKAPEDNLAVLDLIPFGRREFGMEVIAFCMGEAGRWSRLACLLLGSPWTYVQLPGTSAAASGQLAAAEMHTLLATGGWLEDPGR